MARARTSSPTALRRQPGAGSLKGKLSGLVVPSLVFILIIMAFGIGVLYTKLQYLESKTTGGSAVPLAQPQAQPPAPTLTADQLKQLISTGFSKGDPNAKVIFIEFADYQCPFCERFFTQTEPQLLKGYVDTGKVRFVYHDLAFLGQESIWAAEAARCAGDQGKYWDYHDYLFKSQGQENSGAFSKDNLKKFAKAVGLNQSQFDACLDSEKHKDEVNKAVQGAQAAGVSSTPTTFINTRMMAAYNSGSGRWESIGAAPYSMFQSAIEDALK